MVVKRVLQMVGLWAAKRVAMMDDMMVERKAPQMVIATVETMAD